MVSSRPAGGRSFSGGRGENANGYSFLAPDHDPTPDLSCERWDQEQDDEREQETEADQL
jgi:hypothetical protein